MTGRAVVRVCASAILLWLAWHLAGGEAVLATLAAADPRWIAAALALSVPMHALSAARWMFSCRRLGLRLGYRRAVADYYLASLANMLLPGGVGGDAARVWRHARRERAHGGLRPALSGVLLDRAAGQGAMVLALVAGMAVNWTRQPWLAGMTGALAVLAAAIAACLWLTARTRRGAHALAALAADARTMVCCSTAPKHAPEALAGWCMTSVFASRVRHMAGIAPAILRHSRHPWRSDVPASNGYATLVRWKQADDPVCRDASMHPALRAHFVRPNPLPADWFGAAR